MSIGGSHSSKDPAADASKDRWGVSLEHMVCAKIAAGLEGSSGRCWRVRHHLVNCLHACKTCVRVTAHDSVNTTVLPQRSP